MKVLIIGGVAGGASAAARLRRLDESAEIVVVERTGYVSYANCGLPYYVGGVIENDEDLTLQTPESFKARFNVDVRVRNEAVKIDSENKKVTIRRLEDGSEYDESYDKLILSPGAAPIMPDTKGIEDDRVFTVRTVEDVLSIRKTLEKRNPKDVIVAGGGYIGLEVAENLTESGISVTIIQRPDQVLAPFDRDMAGIIHPYLRKKGIKLELKTALTDIIPGDRLTVVLGDGRELEADMAIMAIGVKPDTRFLEGSGVEIGMKGSISVNEKMETSVKDIYAVGDAVQVKNFVSGEDTLIALAGPANRQGRIAADNICGFMSEYKGSQGTSILKIFDMTAASTGLNERAAEKAGLEYDKVYTYSASHATYYPGARNMTLKTLFEPSTGRILGAQIVGYEGVDKRMDVMATAIRANMTAEQLTELDLSYAPPYSSAKDPVNMAGYVIENIRKGLVRQYFWYDVDDLPKDGSVTLLDVRKQDEYHDGHINGYINIPVDELRERMNELDKSKKIYLCCHSGQRSYVALRILSQTGFECTNLSGGFRFYKMMKNEALVDDGTGTPCGQSRC